MYLDVERVIESRVIFIGQNIYFFDRKLGRAKDTDFIITKRYDDAVVNNVYKFIKEKVCLTGFKYL